MPDNTRPESPSVPLRPDTTGQWVPRILTNLKTGPVTRSGSATDAESNSFRSVVQHEERSPRPCGESAPRPLPSPRRREPAAEPEEDRDRYRDPRRRLEPCAGAASRREHERRGRRRRRARARLAPRGGAGPVGPALLRRRHILAERVKDQRRELRPATVE